jgi:hypothetical protein
MKKIEVSSSNIASLSYNEESKELTVEFKNGSEYMYNHVPLKIFEDFLDADSKGKFLNAEIKGNYPFTKL